MSSSVPGTASARSVSAGLIALGSVALVLGVLVYLTDRDPSRALLVPSAPAMAGLALFGTAGAWLPSFAHVFAFSLFTAAACRPGGTPAYRACGLWWTIDVLFEVGQASPFDAALADGLARLGGANALTTAAAGYFRLGTFDPADVVATTAGALAAAVLLRSMTPREVTHAG